MYQWRTTVLQIIENVYVMNLENSDFSIMK